MIVIARNFGQLGNRLMLSANLIAAAHEYDVPLLNPSFATYAKYFESTETDLWCRYPARPPVSERPSMLIREALYRSIYLSGRTLSHLRLTRFPFHVIRISDHGVCDLRTEQFAAKARSGRPILVSGWNFAAGELLVKHAEVIRNFYRILPKHQAAVDELMSRTRKRGEFVVGVHIRQGDYAKFQNGRYFFSLDQYIASMRRIRDRSSHRNVVFLVCGNVPLVEEDFGDLNVCLGTGDVVEDLYSFAATDMLVGPPSTFTGWASFYGNVPLRWITSSDEPFEVVNSPYPFTAEKQPIAYAA